MAEEQLPDERFAPTREYAAALDAADELARYREQFCLPIGPDGEPVIYLCGNSLGLKPRRTRQLVLEALDDWEQLGVAGHFSARRPWFPYHEQFRESGARLVGAEPGEVVMMNSLTVNLHLMLISFFRPQRQRRKILLDAPTFPSDLYAVKSQLELHGLTAQDALLVAEPLPGELIVRHETIEQILAREGESIALVLLSGVNYFTGQLFDIERVTRAAQAHGCVVGFDLAHAAGNAPLALHDWNVDFAVWCSYKYLNSGPGAVGGCFVHSRHGADPSLPRLAGWWGNDPATRFQMHLLPDFVPRAGADGWQLSNPPILALAPLIAALELFDEIGMARLRAKSLRLTGYLAALLEPLAPRIQVITPREPQYRGCQLSIVVEHAEACFSALERAGVVCDLRRPNVIRVAPVPLYNTFVEVWRFAQLLAEA